MSPALSIERTGPGDTVARVTLSRPEVHNAFDAALISELRLVFSALAREEPARLRAVVLAGDGPSFCAGADVNWMRAALSLEVEGNEQDAMAMAEMFETIDTCPAPVIARVHGAALGGRAGARGERVAVRCRGNPAWTRAGGDQPVRHRQDRRIGGRGAVPDGAS